MSIEKQMFVGKQLLPETLEGFGFVKEGGGWTYREAMMKGQFEAVVRLDKAGQLIGRVIDMDLNEEYTIFRQSRVTGSFVGQVREEYQDILERIVKHCFRQMGLVSSQGQYLVGKIAEQFSDRGAQAFEKFPNIYAFRHPQNEKWYALALQLERGKLDLGEETWSKTEQEEKVEVLNIKVPPEEVANLITHKGIYPSYHMNKKHWVTVVLDDSLTDEQVFELVSQSRELVGKGSAPRSGKREYWVLPANPKVYDIDAAFEKCSVMDWPQKASIQEGDRLAIYMTAPIQALRYLCEVRKLHSQDDQVLMQLQVLLRLEDEVFPLSRLQKEGLKRIRSARRLPAKMVSLLEEECANQNRR